MNHAKQIAAMALMLVWISLQLVRAQNTIFASPLQLSFPATVSAPTVADFDGDGRPDVVTAKTSRYPNPGVLKFSRGAGDGSFGSAIDKTLTFSAVQNIAVDLNGDGKPDLALTDVSGAAVHVVLNSGGGNFTEGGTYSVNQPAGTLVAADYNGDGRQDVAVAISTTSQVAVLRGRGDGTLEAPVYYTVGADAYPSSLIAADFNGDRRADLATSNYKGNSVSVLLAKADGTFQPPLQRQVRTEPSGLACGDFNDDGKVDLIIADPLDGHYLQNDATVLLGIGDGTFSAGVRAYIAYSAEIVAVGDINADGKADLVTTGGSTFGDTVLSVALGNGDGTFQSPAVYPRYFRSGTVSSITVSDLNLDGKPEVLTFATATNDATNDSLDIYLNDGRGLLRSTVNYGVGSYPKSIAAADFNGDGWSDLAIASVNMINSGSTVNLLLSRGDGTFRPPVKYAFTQVSAVTAADMNMDGRPDLIVAAGSIYVMPGKGDGTFLPAIISNGGGLCFHAAAADFDNDGKLDLVVSNAQYYAISIVRGRGDGTFDKPVSYPVAFFPNFVAAGDLNADGKPDVILPDGFNNNVVRFLGTGTGTLQTPAASYACGSHPQNVALGDFNSDGKLDVVTADNGNSYGLSLLFGNGNGTLQAALSLSLSNGNTPDAVIAADLNGDGKLDLATANSFDGTTSIFLGNGNGTFAAPMRQIASASPITLAAGDFNGDGRLDLAIPNTGAGDVSILRNFIPTIPTGAKWGTVNSAFNYTIEATGNPLTFTATGLPRGLALDAKTGRITGTPAVMGTFAVKVVAANHQGSASGILTLTIYSPIEGWRMQNFRTLANTGDARDDADGDHDGKVNLLEYASGTNPKIADTGGIPASSLTTMNGEKYLTITFVRPIAVADLTYKVQISGDLNRWEDGCTYRGSQSPLGNAVTAEMSRSGSPMEIIVVRDKTPVSDANARFIRLILEH